MESCGELRAASKDHLGPTDLSPEQRRADLALSERGGVQLPTQVAKVSGTLLVTWCKQLVVAQVKSATWRAVDQVGT
jgi:hypothetical protein